MLKKTLMILLFLPIMLLLGCNPPTMSLEEMRFAQIANLLAKNPLEDQNGFDYHLIQVVDEETVRELTIIQRIDRQNGLKIMTESIESGLRRYDEGAPEYQTETVRYFHNNRIGIQSDDGPVAWQDGTLEAYGANERPLKGLSRVDCASVMFETDGASTVLKATIRAEAVSRLTGLTDTTFEEVRVEIIFQESTDTLQSIRWILVQPESTITILYTPHYASATVLLP